VSDRSGVFGRLKARGEEVFSQLSNDLMANPHFVKALQGAVRGKEALDQAASRALKSMNVPTRTEFKRALGRIEALEAELAALKAKAARSAKASSPRKTKTVRKPTRAAQGRGTAE
jgi:hypothetical protein